MKHRGGILASVRATNDDALDDSVYTFLLVGRFEM
jgi:hypothetical protein